MAFPDAGRRDESGLKGGLAGGGVGAFDSDLVVSGISGIEGDDDFLGWCGVEREAGVIGGEGKATTTAVDEHSELDLGRTTMIEELVERGFHGAAGEENVIHEDDVGPVHIAGNVRGSELLRDRMAADVVAMEGDVEGAGSS